MKKKILSAEEKAALQAKVSTLEQDLVVLRATKEEGADNASVIEAKEGELDAAQAKLEASEAAEQNEILQKALFVQREKDADAAVLAAVKKGAIKVKDLDLQKKWKDKCIEDPSNIALLASMNGSAALTAADRIIVRPNVTIQRESSLSVLTAFGSEGNPLKRAALYATEIRKRLAEGDPMELPSLQANNNLGTLVGTLVSQRTLELLKFKFPMLASITTDFSDMSAKLGQDVNTRVVTVPAAQDYDPANGWPDSDAITTPVDVTLNKQKGVPITFTSADLSGTVRRLFDEFGEAQAYSLAKSMVDALYALFTVANYPDNPAVVSAQIDFSRSTLIDVGTALDDQGVPDGPTNRFCLLNSKYYGQLKKDQAIISLSAFQDKEIIEEGVLPDVEGFRVIKAPNLTTAAGGNLVGMAGSRSSAVIATRIDSDYVNVLPGASYGNATVVTDPDIGLSVFQVQYVNHQKATATQRISFIFGVAKGQTKAGQPIKSA